MITKSGIDPNNFKSAGTGTFNTGLQDTYTASVPTELFVLENKNGMEVCITNLGARIVSVMAPDRDRNLKDVVLGFDNIAQYADFDGQNNVFGAVVGRYANRIGNGKFLLDGKEYTLPINNGPNCLHGGVHNWTYQTYNVEKFDAENQQLKLSLTSPDGDEGFPGEVVFSVTYTLSDENSLIVEYEATTSKPTVLNVTNHTYFNLEGNPRHDTLNDELFVAAKFTTKLGENTLPNGEIVKIEKGGPLDFYGTSTENLDKPQFKKIGADINANDEQIKAGNGYDHNFVLLSADVARRERGVEAPEGLNFAAELRNPVSGISMKVMTTEPGVQLYDAVDLDGSLVGKNGVPYGSLCSTCLETQHFADSPNNSHFPSTVLRPGQVFHSKTEYKFSAK